MARLKSRLPRKTCSEASGRRSDDRDRGGGECPDGGEQRGDEEHDPGDGGDVAADELHRPADQQVDGAVVLRDGEQVGDPDQRQHQLRGEAAEDLVGGEADRQRADHEGGDEGERAHVDRQERGDREDDDQRDDGDDLG
jgi:hypothetical protein